MPRLRRNPNVGVAEDIGFMLGQGGMRNRGEEKGGSDDKLFYYY